MASWLGVARKAVALQLGGRGILGAVTFNAKAVAQIRLVLHQVTDFSYMRKVLGCCAVVERPVASFVLARVGRLTD